MALATAATLAGITACSGSRAENLKSLDASLVNDSIPAGTDFYEHVTEKWQKAHPLTAEYSRYGQFNVLNDSSENRVKEIITGLAATNPEPGSVAFKVSTIYNQPWTPPAATTTAPHPSRPTSGKSRTLPTRA